jgi:hypothetical protein
VKTWLKFVVIALVALTLVVPVSAKTAGPSAGIAGPDVAPNLVNWYENWDAYPTGQNMHGVGGWKGWGNSSAATAYTSDVQRISLPNSIDIHGDSDLVHEYAIDDGVWTYTAWQFVPADFSGQSYFILLNDYDDACNNCNWSVQVNFDSSNNLVTNVGITGGTLPLVKGEWVEIRLEIDLVANTQSFYYGGDLLYTGTWTEENSGGGITSIGAVDLYAQYASAVYYDDLSLVEPGVEEPMHIGDIAGAFHLDPYGRTQLLMWATAHDANHGLLGEVAVDGTITPPQGGAYVRTRMTKNVNGAARFVWGSNFAGTWMLCVDNLTKAGYVYAPGDNDVPECAVWNN